MLRGRNTTESRVVKFGGELRGIKGECVRQSTVRIRNTDSLTPAQMHFWHREDLF